MNNPTRTCRRKTQNRHRVSRKKTRKKSGSHFLNISVNIVDVIESGNKTVVEDVKKIIAAIEQGQSIEQLKSEITRVHMVVVDGHLQGKVIDECGKDVFLKFCRIVRKLRIEKTKNDKKNTTKKRNFMDMYLERDVPINIKQKYGSKNYGAQSQNTRKEWGSAYKPARG